MTLIVKNEILIVAFEISVEFEMYQVQDDQPSYVMLPLLGRKDFANVPFSK